MPTTRKRHAVTETDAVARALRIARARWPDVPPAQLLTQLIAAGAERLEEEADQEALSRARSVAALTDLAPQYPAAYLEDVRAGWDD